MRVSEKKPPCLPLGEVEPGMRVMKAYLWAGNWGDKCTFVCTSSPFSTGGERHGARHDRLFDFKHFYRLAGDLSFRLNSVAQHGPSLRYPGILRLQQ